MLETGMRNQENAAAAAGLSGSGKVFWNLAGPTLYERAIARGEARLSATGALVVESGIASGAAPLTRYRVGEPAEASEGTTPEGTTSEATALLGRAAFDVLRDDMLAHASGRTLFAQDLHVAIAPGQIRRLRVFTEHAWHALAIRNLMQAPERDSIGGFVPDITLFCLPAFRPDADRHGIAGPGLIAEDAEAGLLLVSGTLDLGHVEQALVAHVGDVLAGAGALTLSGAASLDAEGGLTLFLGPADSGKSALAGALTADPRFVLIADGPLGWSRDGVFGLFTGRRRRVHALDGKGGFGTILENVPLDADSREPDLSAAPAARAVLPGSEAGHAGAARTLFLVSCDGFGVLPAIARLSPEQAVYHLLSGYTAPAEDGAPRARFAPDRHPAAGAHLLRELIAGGDTVCWLVNTGWSGGQAGRGVRIPSEASHILVAAALDGSLAAGAFRPDPHFGFEVPVEVEGVEAKLLDPVGAWANRRDHAVAAKRLVGMFAENFARFEAEVDPEVREAQPRMAIAAE
ncbi:phosphoenolpyruvate carboxykinase (ATP) [Ancylobacter sp. Lp-2]|uniref:phosphoenolpyruvate carboxykinase (ATP) n=1 Tax=Ancylobacter sp. Lp-2 TaxID=2881339 RepID=UPI001E588172|nr:phosphoenolpyruvate carboxykinase (ATP) [Ancylobacter sp. Lp-2]MCB4770514.1 phosphoenolpyruvate carboxykinase (ATP) [Ancylobacter sp. Lp-2]